MSSYSTQTGSCQYQFCLLAMFMGKNDSLLPRDALIQMKVSRIGLFETVRNRKIDLP